MEPSGKLELTWTNKHLRLLSDEAGGYTWVSPSDYRVAEVRLLHDEGTVGETHADRSRAQDNLLIRGDALNALTSLCELPEFAREYVGKVKLAYLDPPFNTQQAFEHYDDALEHSVWLTMMRDRLLQIRKLLAPDGSVWVHCDYAESHYLKVMMDEVFGRDNFRNEVIWKRTSAHSSARRFGPVHETLLFYSQSSDYVWNELKAGYGAEYVAKRFRADERPWKDADLTGAGIRHGTTGESWRGFDPNEKGRHWSYPPSELDRLDTQGLIYWPKKEGGWPRLKRYLDESRGVLLQDLWTDIDPVNSQARERSGFGTQKPEALLARVVGVATNPGDVVLDCFAGSGTTAAVAHKLGRRWVTVEQSAPTVETFTRPRLEKVVAGDDSGGITKDAGWEGGGGFRVLEVAPSMFAEVDGRVWLADWAVDRELAEATAAQLGYDYEPDAPFAGRKGRTRLAVVDGLVNGDVVELLVGALAPDEKIVVCGTAVDPEATQILRTLRKGSRTRKIPASILAEYRIAQDWRTEPSPAPEPATA